MKSTTALSCLAALMTTVVAGHAQNPFVPGDDPFTKSPEREPPAMLGFLFEWVRLDHATANELVRKHVIKGNAADLRDAVQLLLESGDAELAESTYLNVRTGERAKIESIEELIYPTDFDPAGGPETPEGKMPPLVLVSPSAFDVRNVGTTIEIDPAISSDHKAIDVNLAPEMVQYLGDHPLNDLENPVIEHAAVRQPDFFTLRTSAAVTIRDGETVLAAVLTPNPKTHPDKRVFLFVLGRILR